MKTLPAISSLLILATSVAVAQEIHPVWVQHHNGLINVQASDKLPILVKAGATGDEAYAGGGHGKIEGFVNFLRYDDNHYLLGINENGIDEATETDPAKLDAAAKCPDRSLVWIDAGTGKWLGVAIKVAIDEAPLATQSANPFWWKIAVDEGAYGQKAVYSGFKYKILRYAPTGTTPDAGFPAGRPTWEATATEAWVEPVPDEPNPSRPPLSKFVPAIHYNNTDAGVDPTRLPGLPAPTTADDPLWSSYLNSSSGDGSASFRVKALRVAGSGINTILWTGGATWRASTHEQEYATDDGLNFYPIARLNDRGDCWGTKGCYSLGGQPSNVRTAPDGRKWCIQGHYPGTGWPARPGRYTKDPAATDDIGRDPNAVPPLDANDAGPNHKSRPHYYDPDNRAVGGLPAFTWESAGTAGNCPPNHRVDGVERYDGNWVLTADTKDGTDYIVSYSIPSWDQQFGRVGADWPNSVDPNSIFKPGWVGIHTLDGKMAPGANNAWKLPAYEIDEPIVDPSGNAGTGFDYGYTGDVTVYPDATAPAGSGRALVLVSFGEYGFGVFAVSNAPARGSIVNPANVTTEENHPVVLSGKFTGTGSPLFYRWQKAGVGVGTFTDIAGASGNLAKFGHNTENFSYTIPVAQKADSGEYRFVVGNSAGSLNSVVATVFVTTDITPPTAVSVSSLDGTSIDLCFNELLDAGNPDNPAADPGSARNLANYVISGTAAAQAATLGPDGRTVRLEGVTGLVSPFTVRVTGVRDKTRNNPIPAPGQTVSGVTQGFTAVDIGDTTDPGSTYTCEPGTFDVWAGGVDFWGTADSGRFTYQERSGDFDVRVQIEANERPSNRNGIMVRESTDPGAAMVHITWNPDVKYGAHVRTVSGGPADWFSPERDWVCDDSTPPNVWLRLQRVGDDFTAYRSSDGYNWITAGTTTLALANPLLGLASNRGGGTGLGHTTFANYGDNKALSIKVEGGVTVLSWTGGGVLEAAPNITGPWSSNGLSQNNPQNVTTSGSQQFFRLR